MGQFSASRAKIERAKKHIAELERITSEYFSSVWYCIDFGSEDQFDAKGLSLTFRGAPKDYSLIVGDAVHNLRSALDLMAVELVAANNQNTKGVHFPFAENAAQIDNQIKYKKFDRASAAAVSELKRWKPYKGGNLALRGLHDLDIADKHKTLIPVSSAGTTPPIGILTDETGKPVGFEEGKLKLWVDTSVEPKVTHVFPANFPFADCPIIETLHELEELVTEMLDNFEKVVP